MCMPNTPKIWSGKQSRSSQQNYIATLQALLGHLPSSAARSLPQTRGHAQYRRSHDPIRLSGAALTQNSLLFSPPFFFFLMNTNAFSDHQLQYKIYLPTWRVPRGIWGSHTPQAAAMRFCNAPPLSVPVSSPRAHRFGWSFDRPPHALGPLHTELVRGRAPRHAARGQCNQPTPGPAKCPRITGIPCTLRCTGVQLPYHHPAPAHTLHSCARVPPSTASRRPVVRFAVCGAVHACDRAMGWACEWRRATVSGDGGCGLGFVGVGGQAAWFDGGNPKAKRKRTALLIDRSIRPTLVLI